MFSASEPSRINCCPNSNIKVYLEKRHNQMRQLTTTFAEKITWDLRTQADLMLLYGELYE